MQAHDQHAQVTMVCVAPPALPNVATTNAISGASIVNDEDIIDNDDYGTEPPPSYITDFLDWALGPEMRRQLQSHRRIISFGGDIALAFLPFGDLIDLLYQMYLGMTGQEVDELTLTFSVLGLVSDLGWLQPFPSVEDTSNATFAILKAIVKRLPKGKARDRLTELLKQVPNNPEVANRLQAIFSKFSSHPQLIPWLSNPKVLVTILDEGPEFVDLLLKYGDDAFKATDVLGKNAYAILKQYDKISSRPGANQLLKNLGVGGDTTRQAKDIIEMINLRRREEEEKFLIQLPIQQIIELVEVYTTQGILWSKGKSKKSLYNMFDHVIKHYKEFDEFSSLKEYVLTAKDISFNPPEEAWIKDCPDGRTFILIRSRVIFLVKNKRGEIATMFRPDPKKHGYPTNEDYFNAQCKG